MPDGVEEDPFRPPTTVARGDASLCRLWRTVGPGALSRHLAKPVLAAAANAAPPAGDVCAAVLGGDAPSIVRAARLTLERHGPGDPAMDVPAAAALAAALAGDRAAAAFLAEALAGLAAVRPGEPHLARFSRAWAIRAAGASAPGDA